MILINHQYGKKFLLPVFLIYSVLAACKKNDDVPKVPDVTAKEPLWADSVFLYASQVYLWNEQLPAIKDFNPRRYVSSEGQLHYKKELFDISQMAINSQTGNPYEFNRLIPSIPKYSAIFGASDNGPEMVTAEVSDRFGVSIVVVQEQALYVKYVVKGSDAERAGIRRGMRIVSINGRPVEITAAYIATIMKIFNEGTQLDLLCRDHNVDRRYSLAYKRNNYFEPILKDTVLSLPDGRKAGYLAYLRFTDVRHVYKDLDRVTGGFAASDVSDVIIDLRYNGGGNLTELDRLANLLAPFAADGKVMRREQYNDLVKSGKATLLSKQPIFGADGLPIYYNGRVITYGDVDYTEEKNTVYFNKTAGIGTLKDLYVIVSEHTASAAELLVSCLQPYLKIKIIGVSAAAGNLTAVRTYGKPVGFFPLVIGNMSVYYSLFRNVNANGKGDYYDGLQADISVYDDPQFDFGSRGEAGLEAALALISGQRAQHPATELIRGAAASWRDLNVQEHPPGMQKSTIMLKDGTSIRVDR
ncbi:PDZ domain-containing protein [Chitinophaga oryzae]|uniref:PDZ domain-containing protein n=1 Tax=Chitinophaga oryzae TaxID=2725414 RepID=A0ABX6LFX4_9BACT|nr:S41 family peptidase [Chitinophaga oryzae]QJB37792.1 PDZ domain-containing protein [Chitinophaga oryzae]